MSDTPQSCAYCESTETQVCGRCGQPACENHLTSSVFTMRPDQAFDRLQGKFVCEKCHWLGTRDYVRFASIAGAVVVAVFLIQAGEYLFVPIPLLMGVAAWKLGTWIGNLGPDMKPPQSKEEGDG